MSGKTLNFVEVEIKNKSHGSKQLIVLIFYWLPFDDVIR